MGLFGFTRQHLWTGLPMTGLLIGWYLDRKETERMIRFRDKSALYGGRVKPGDPPSWPSWVQ